MHSIVTREERETLVLDLYNQGKSIREIAKETNSELQI
jgi:DNA-binding NarL/FixJ family response regulator